MLQILLALAILAALSFVTLKVNKMTQVTDRLATVVRDQTTVIASAVEVINGIPALIGEAVRAALVAEDTEDAAVEAAVTLATTDAESNTAALRTALTANTPAR